MFAIPPTLTRLSDKQEFVVKPGMTVGRKDADMLLTADKASRRHAQFSIEDNGVWVEDLGSTNGTFVNGKRITSRVRLVSGDRVRFDVEEFEFRVVDSEKTELRELDVRTLPTSERKPERPMRTSSASRGGRTIIVSRDEARKLFAHQGRNGAPTTVVHEPHLEIMSGSLAQCIIKLIAEPSGHTQWTIGSQLDCDIVFTDSGVSNLHARLVNEGTTWTVIDQMSVHGTWVNGRRGHRFDLSSGTVVRFGPVQCTFRTTAAQLAKEQETTSKRPPNIFRTIGITLIAALTLLLLAYALSLWSKQS
jgi:pSer/pThr/pTyr-binding forkhead associated (FHA) protein